MSLLERQELSISPFYKDSSKIYTRVAEKDSQTYLFRSKLVVCAVSEPKFFIPQYAENFPVKNRVES